MYFLLCFTVHLLRSDRRKVKKIIISRAKNLITSYTKRFEASAYFKGKKRAMQKIWLGSLDFTATETIS